MCLVESKLDEWVLLYVFWMCLEYFYFILSMLDIFVCGCGVVAVAIGTRFFFRPRNNCLSLERWNNDEGFYFPQSTPDTFPSKPTNYFFLFFIPFPILMSFFQSFICSKKISPALLVSYYFFVHFHSQI